MKRNMIRSAMTWFTLLFAAQIWSQSEVIVARQSAPTERADRFFSSNGNFISIGDLEINFFDSIGRHQCLEPIRKANYANPTYSHTVADSSGKYFAHAYNGFYPKATSIIDSSFHGIVFDAETSEVVGTNATGNYAENAIISPYNKYVSFSPDEKQCAISGNYTTVINLDKRSGKSYGFPIYRLMNHGLALVWPTPVQVPKIVCLETGQTRRTWLTTISWNEIEHTIVDQSIIGFDLGTHSLIVRDMNTGIITHSYVIEDFGPYGTIKLKRKVSGELILYGTTYAAGATDQQNIVYAYSHADRRLQRLFKESTLTSGVLEDINESATSALMEGFHGRLQYYVSNLTTGESSEIEFKGEPGITRIIGNRGIAPFIALQSSNGFEYRLALDGQVIHVQSDQPSRMIVASTRKRYALTDPSGPVEVFEMGTNRSLGKIYGTYAPDLGSYYSHPYGKAHFYRLNETRPWLEADANAAISFSRNGKFLILMRYDRDGIYPFMLRFSVYNVDTGKLVSAGNWMFNVPSSVELSDDGRYAAFGWDAFTAYGGFWQYYAGKNLCLVKLTPSAQVIPIDWDNPVSSAIFSPDGNHLYCIGGGEALGEVNCDTNIVDRTYRIQSHDWNEIKFLDISRDGRKFVIDRNWSSDATIRLPD